MNVQRQYFQVKEKSKTTWRAWIQILKSVALPFHEGSKKTKCNICQKSVISLESHLSNVHEGQKQQQKMKCEICQKIYNSKSRLKVHVSKTHKETKEQYCCDICNQYFKLAEYLKRHRKIVHEKTSIKSCSYCSKFFNQKTTRGTK